MPDSAGASTFLKSEESGPRIVLAGLKIATDSAGGRKWKSGKLIFQKNIETEILVFWFLGFLTF